MRDLGCLSKPPTSELELCRLTSRSSTAGSGDLPVLEGVTLKTQGSQSGAKSDDPD